MNAISKLELFVCVFWGILIIIVILDVSGIYRFSLNPETWLLLPVLGIFGNFTVDAIKETNKKITDNNKDKSENDP